MSWFKPVSRAELGAKYTHSGWFLGLVPVYLGDIDSDTPVVAERNWVPEWYFWLVEAVFGLFCWANSILFKDFEPAFPIVITGRIEP